MIRTAPTRPRPDRAQAPALDTPRLRLRPHRADDIEALVAFYGSPRARFIGAGPTAAVSREKVWTSFACEVGSWPLLGFGPWALETRDGTLVGQVAITAPPRFPEPEIGWVLFDGHEGRGYATEAATAALFWAWDAGFETLVSYIDPDNAASIAVARRIGGRPDPAADLPDGETAEETVVYRHAPDADGNAEAYA